MTRIDRGLAPWPGGIAVPAVLVAVSVGFLGTLAIGTVLDAVADRERYTLFAVGVACWVVGIGWGVLANGRPAARMPWR